MSNEPETRDAYPSFEQITTRWMDNDVYGHVNNVVYYSFFDTAVSGHMIRSGAIDIVSGPVAGYAIETGCRFFAPIAYPDLVTAGLRVGHLGTTSVRYEIGLFRNDENTAAAQGFFVHVYVDRAMGRPVPIPDEARRVLAKLHPAR